MDISDVLALARELNLTHIANGEVDLTNERVSNLDYLYTVLQEEVEIRHIERVKKLTKRSRRCPLGRTGGMVAYHSGKLARLSQGYYTH